MQPTPQQALAAYTRLYTNWTYHTLTTNQRTLAAISLGAARLTEQQAAAQNHTDTTITRGHIRNHGETISISQDLTDPNKWIIVTREQTTGNNEYQTLPAAYHITIAHPTHIPGGWAISEWQPQS